MINFEVPQYAEDYIHRIGRTGRAGACGDAITFVSRDEQQYLRRIEQFTGKRFAVRQYPGTPIRIAPQPRVPETQAVNTTSHGSGHTSVKRQRPDNHRSHSKRPLFVSIAKKKKPLRELDVFSSSSDSQSWSNY